MFTPLAVAKNRTTPALNTVSGAARANIAATNPGFALAYGSNRNVNTNNKITRGYIRRDPDKNDPTSRYRLNFMFNPESIERSYVAYLDQGAIDPFNTIYGSGNLVAPPGILDFTFDLVFDRQIENASDIHNVGTKIDYDYFDRVVRASEPGLSPAINNIPDNGVLLVNPRNITVVFSNQLTVQGRPYNATVTYSKFSHRMIPIRMMISLNMKVFYIGPPAQPFDLHLNDSVETFKATVAYDQQVKATEAPGAGPDGAYVLPDVSVYDTLFPPAVTVTNLFGGGSASGGAAYHPTGGPGSYVNPFAAPGDPPWGLARTDMGVDYLPQAGTTNPVRAIGDCVITTSRDHTGWPGFGNKSGGAYMAYLLNNGTHGGRYIYVAENLTGLAPVGSQHKAGDIIATAHPGYAWTEWGWATPPNGASPVAHTYYHEGAQTADGKAFARFLRGLGASTYTDPGPGSDQPGSGG